MYRPLFHLVFWKTVKTIDSDDPRDRRWLVDGAILIAGLALINAMGLCIERWS